MIEGNIPSRSSQYSKIQATKGRDTVLTISSVLQTSSIQVFSAPNSMPGSNLASIQRSVETEGSTSHQEQGFQDLNNIQVRLLQQTAKFDDESEECGDYIEVEQSAARPRTRTIMAGSAGRSNNDLMSAQLMKVNPPDPRGPYFDTSAINETEQEQSGRRHQNLKIQSLIQMRPQLKKYSGISQRQISIESQSAISGPKVMSSLCEFMQKDSNTPLSTDDKEMFSLDT